MSKQKKTYAVGGASAVQQAEERSPLLAQKIIFMVVLVLVAALVLTATIIYANYTEPELSEKSNVAETIPTSSATIRNGGFDYVTPSSENKIGYPFVAANWTLTRESNTKTIAGVVPVSEDTWSTVSDQLSALGADVENPGEPENSVKNDDENKHNVYMLYNIDDTYSNLKNYTSFSAASKSYNKVTIWVKTIDVISQTSISGLKRAAAPLLPSFLSRMWSQTENGRNTPFISKEAVPQAPLFMWKWASAVIPTPISITLRVSFSLTTLL